MSTSFRYGRYTHDDSSVTFQITKQDELNAGGRPFKRRESWNLEGVLIGSSPAELAEKMRELDRAYGVHFQDAEFTDGGGNVLRAMRNAGSMSGVVVASGPNYPVQREHFVTRVPFTITLTVEAPVLATDPFSLLSFSETLSFSGGGPRYTVIETAQGEPVKHRNNKKTAYRCTQSGSAVGRGAYPPPPPPLFPDDLLEAPRVTRTTPQPQGQRLEGYAVTWSYEFASRRPLRGVPKVWNG